MCDLAARTRRWITQQMILIAIALLAAIAPVLAFDDGEQFRERLLIRPLPDHNVLLHFDFNMTIDRLLDPDDEHYRFFPKSIAQIITKHQVGEFVLKLTQGRWRYAHWGLPVVPAPTGAELIAWVHRHDSDPTVGSQRWSGVQQSLSGMLCASLQQLGKNVHTCRRVPDSAIAPESRPVFVNTSTHETFYGVLPREAVCTENLTPWAKLLPCRTRGGLGRLLSPLDLHDASYHSMGIHVYSETNANNEQRTIARFFLSVVLDPTYLYRSKVWSLRSLLPHATLPMQCSPVSTECEVHFDAVNAINANGATPGLTTPVPIRRTGNVLVFDPTDFDLSFDPGHEYLAKFPVRDTPIVVQRYATGRGLQSGGIVNTVVNSGSVARNVTLFDTLPWYFRVYFHTLSMTINGSVIEPSFMSFQPARQDSSPSMITIEVEIPPMSTCLISMQYDKVFLPIKDFPPDVARGFDLGPAVVNVAPNGPRLYTESLIVLFPGPDMSMPFNVIAFTSTFLAFFFGTMFNVLYRHPTELSSRERGGLLVKLIRFLIGKGKAIVTSLKDDKIKQR